MINYIKRMDGRVERLCSHRVGHTVFVPAPNSDEWAYWAHGCDGCCKSDWKYQYERNHLAYHKIPEAGS